ncbi:MAG: copper resistance CopC/CopD family protein [Solirubrobacterales bacterium]
MKTVSLRSIFVGVVFAACLFVPVDASAHAQLEQTSPLRGAVLKQAPSQVEFRFGEPVEAAFGAVRVFDSQARRVDSGVIVRSHGAESIGVKLRTGLPDGAYTATYRVISADSHPVSGGFVFSVGKATVAPAASVANLVQRGNAGKVTQAGFWTMRFVGYLALAVAIGALMFWLLAMRDAPFVAVNAFTVRAGRLVGLAIAAGVVASACDLVFQGAVAAGESFWQALSPAVVNDVVGTRSGGWMFARLTLWGCAAIVWLAFAARRNRPLAKRAVFVVLALLTLAAATPGLAGHAGVTAPRWLMIPSDWVHVLAMAIWAGGLVAAVFALPAATQALDPAARGGLLVGALGRFSPVALACVTALLVTGVAQSVIHLSAFDQLWSTAFGRAISIKVGLFAVLIGYGACNRFRLLPQLRAREAAGQSPGAAGVTIKRSLVTEVALASLTIAVASALVVYPPSASVASGPFNATTTIGPVEMQITVDPARVGANQVHLYLTNPKTGALYTRTKELQISSTLPKAGIGPIDFDARRAGPGHYVVGDAIFGAKGNWRLRIELRVSEFDQFERSLQVPIN